MRNFLQKQRNLDLNFSAFNDPFQTTLDFEDQDDWGGLSPQILNNAKSDILEVFTFLEPPR